MKVYRVEKPNQTIGTLCVIVNCSAGIAWFSLKMYDSSLSPRQVGVGTANDVLPKLPYNLCTVMS
jgi:hypothetical protein